MYWMTLNSTTSAKTSSSIYVQYQSKLNDFIDINGDGTKDFAVLMQSDTTSLDVTIHDIKNSETMVLMLLIFHRNKCGENPFSDSYLLCFYQ